MRTKKANVDEIMSRRKDISGASGTVLKAAKAPNSWNKQDRSCRFVMNAQAPDRMGDVIVTAGIDTTEFERNPVGLLFHSSRSWPIGSWSDLEKKTAGRPPRLEGTLNLLPANGPIKEIDETAWMIENGGVRACSIGFRPDWEQAEMILDEEGKWQGGIQWNACELLEGSVVPLPASPESLAKSAGGDFRLAREFIEEVLDTYAKTPEGILLPLADYERAYKRTVEKVADDAIVPVAAAADAEAMEPMDPEDEPMDPEDMPEEPMEEDSTETGKAFTDVIAKAATVPENKTGTKIGSLILELDTSDAEAKIEKVGGFLAKLAEKFPMFFPKAAAEERVEPVIVPIEPPAPPSGEAIAAARAKASALRDRLASKGLIAA
ncbi:MAG: HK97 family phage prohead protease [Minisyncoccota bacterium]